MKRYEGTEKAIRRCFGKNGQGQTIREDPQALQSRVGCIPGSPCPVADFAVCVCVCLRGNI